MLHARSRTGRGALAQAALGLLLGALTANARAAPPPYCPGPSLGSDEGPPSSTPWKDASQPPDARAEALLRAMALEEEIDLATGERCLLYGYYDAPIARLGIPALTMTDGPAGIRIPYQHVNGGKATLLPAPIALAASFDPALAADQGDVLGAEAFLTGHNVLLGPTLDLARDPLAGRTFEGFGEDPLLAARMAVPLIQAIQKHPVLADAKHFVAYGQETDRFTVDAEVDERALRELYLRPFQAAVADASVGSVMCGFNRVNGQFACEDRALLTDVLKGDLGFQGYVLSDWASIHGTRLAAEAGLDQELAFEKYFGHSLLGAVQDGTVARDVVDDKARRILRSMFRFGLMDQPVQVGPLPDADHAGRSRAIAEQGMVLLKNAGGLLPLGAGVRSVAVIGADANDAATQGGGAARVEPTYSVSPLDGIAARAGQGVQVKFAPGGDPVTAAHLLPGPPAIPSSVLTPEGFDDGTRGLRGQYWLNPSFAGPPEVIRVDHEVALSLGFFDYPSINASSEPQLEESFALQKVSARWNGTLTAPASGTYTLTLTDRGQGWVWLDGQLVLDHSGTHELESRSATVQLDAGSRHAIRVDYVADAASIGVATDRGGDVKLGWQVPPGTVLAPVRDAAALAAASDVAVVVARDYGSEERDHPDLALPSQQDALIATVAAANPRTVVVLTTGQGVAMPWLDAVPAVVEAWYPGQLQGEAIARVLFGDVNPSGKLPLTFPRALDQTPVGAGPPAASDAVGPVVAWSEGLLMGYRWYDAKGVTPLFPFGFGLSYTTFGYSGLAVGPATTDGSGRRTAQVSFTLANTGGRAGAEVAQVYVGPCPGEADPVPQRLAGFAKVALAPGASQQVTIPLAPEALERWDAAKHAWTAPDCATPVFVGSSSREILLTGAIGGAVTAPGPTPTPTPGAGPVTATASPGHGGCASGGAGGAASLLGLLAAAGLARRRR
ncbi:beta-glucosidase [Anaeromyxobacter paludicola]|uniref:Beta-glucosidase n=1 Tax=Anaeromyxobacter paludicola TaxID=2918171 RepID=A0ABM7XFU2_9BACT|nr:beta-glucosidase [Anaeromyxobacter paludicola]BDG10739.1 beta-glucosidase [Anaeromyxobacter paludicola]